MIDFRNNLVDNLFSAIMAQVYYIRRSHVYRNIYCSGWGFSINVLREKWLIDVILNLYLGALIAYHSLLITKGETCIERHINKKESDRLSKVGKKFKNPYNFGPRENWKRFLGLNRNEISWIDIILPSKYPPEGDGLHWITSNIDHKI
jgi:hypothetical protein